MLHTRKSLYGFSLIELVVLVAIIGILATLSVPLFTDFVDRFRVKAAAENFYFAAQSARIEAIKRNTRVYISFTTGDSWCYGINTESACTCTTPASCNLGVTTYSSAEQTTLSAAGFTGNSFYFEDTRGAASTSGSITFTSYGKSSPLITSTINRLGNLDQCATGISSYTAC